MPETPPATDWIASGGAYWIIGGAWLATAVFFYIIAQKVGKVTRSESDGCLLGICNIVLSLLGGGAGYFLAPYPLFLLTSVAGAVTLPTLATLFFLSRLKRPQR